MGEDAVLPVAIILAALIWCSLGMARPLLAALLGEYRPNTGSLAFYSVLTAGAIMACFALGVPLPGHYLVLYACTYAGMRGLSSAPRSRLLFTTNLCTVHLAAVHLFIVGIMALGEGASPYHAWREPGLWEAAMAVTVLSFLLLLLMLRSIADLRALTELADMTVHQKDVGRYVWFAVGYVFFDSVACMFPLPYALVSWFLVGSCLLLGVQLYLFLLYAYRVSIHQHYEKEYQELERERAVHVQRTLELRKIASVDSVTGAYTRAYVMSVLHQWLQEQKGFSLAYIDLNGLKAVNDRHGHDAGDDYLATAAEALNDHLRKQDVLARIGGDEFLVLLPDTPAAQVHVLLEQAEQALARQTDKPYPLSFCCGVEEVKAGWPENADDLLHRADRRMYEAKKRRKRLPADGEEAVP